jgi:catechol 2,3-dioxygenase-like lactoylglutathione lyase family enzyme
MTSTQPSSDMATGVFSSTAIALRFEVALLPVADVDRAKAFYQRLGWRLDADFPVDEHYRVVQFTPPGSPASIQFGTGVTTLAPGSMQDMMLVVDDIDAASWRQPLSHRASAPSLS